MDIPVILGSRGWQKTAPVSKCLTELRGPLSHWLLVTLHLYRASGKSSFSLPLTISNLLVLVSSVVFLLFYSPCPGIQQILNTHVQDRLITTHVQCRSLSPKDSQANEDCSLWKESEFSLIRNTRQCHKKPSPWTKERSWSISLKNCLLSMYISWKQLQFLIVKFRYQALLCL